MCLACAENLVGDVNLYCVIVRHIIPPHYLKPEINPREKLTTITLCAWFVYTQSSIVNLSRVYEEQYRKEQRKRKERREREREREDLMWEDVKTSIQWKGRLITKKSYGITLFYLMGGLFGNQIEL